VKHFVVDWNETIGDSIIVQRMAIANMHDVFCTRQHRLLKS